MAPRGRPKKIELRDMVVTFRLTHAHYQALQASALRQGQSIGELTRQVVEAYVTQHGTPPPPPAVKAR